jgi:hypothetical protein
MHRAYPQVVTLQVWCSDLVECLEPPLFWLAYLPVASRQYLPGRYFVASFENLRRGLAFQAVLTGGLAWGAFFA